MRDTLLRMLLCEDVAAQYAAADAAVVRMLLRDIRCCGRCCACEDVAARYAAADAAGVRMLLRDTLLRTLLV